MRRWVIWITLFCFVATQTAAVAGPFEEGTAAGQAANPVIRATVNAPSASNAVPGYTSRRRKPRITASQAWRGRPMPA
jgi:conjugal transfer mating pair stabilization protein TraN